MTNNTIFEVDELQLIVFRLGNEEYTVPINVVQEIILPQKTTHIPKSATFIEGVINLRGKVIPIIDGRKKFDIAHSGETAEERIIILELSDHTVGLIVDAVSEVVHLQTKTIEPPPIECNDDNDFILGVGKYKDKLLILLEPEKLLTGHEVKSLNMTLKTAADKVETIKMTETEEVASEKTEAKK